MNSDRTPVRNFHLFIYAESDKAENVESRSNLMCFQYPRDSTVVEVRIATSLISYEQAQISLRRELPVQNNFDIIAKETKTVWNRYYY